MFVKHLCCKLLLPKKLWKTPDLDLESLAFRAARLLFCFALLLQREPGFGNTHAFDELVIGHQNSNVIPKDSGVAMFIGDVEIVLKHEDDSQEDLVKPLVDTTGDLFGSTVGRLRYLSAEQYAENGTGREDGLPVFVSVLRKKVPR